MTSNIPLDHPSRYNASKDSRSSTYAEANLTVPRSFSLPDRISVKAWVLEPVLLLASGESRGPLLCMYLYIE